jgi:hypothetical protein
MAAEYPLAAFVAIGKILQKKGDVAHLQIAAPAQLMGHVDGDILRPAFGGVEPDNAYRILVLAGERSTVSRSVVSAWLPTRYFLGGRDHPAPGRRSDRLN